jgi:hypothetical protein
MSTEEREVAEESVLVGSKCRCNNEDGWVDTQQLGEFSRIDAMLPSKELVQILNCCGMLTFVACRKSDAPATISNCVTLIAMP